MAGLDEDLKIEVAEEEKVTEFPKRRPFTYWKVGNVEHKLKLTTAMTCKLEEKYKSNLMNIILDDGLPPLYVMLTIIQGAMITWEHGVKFEKVQEIYDKYKDEGGSQMSLFTDVLIPTMAVSGFFTQEQEQEILKRMNETLLQ